MCMDWWVDEAYLTEAEEVVVYGQHGVLDCHYHQIYLVSVYVDQRLDCAPCWLALPTPEEFTVRLFNTGES